jgi:hypothetical protein
MQSLIKPVSAIKESLMDFANRHRFIIAYGIIIISSLFLLPEFKAEMRGDVVVFQGIANDLFNGILPYRDRVVEYPPYAVPIFLLPRLFGEANYLDGFLSLAFIADWLVKLSLFAIGFRQSKTARALLPLLLYCAAVPCIHFFYLQRYDIWPALISLLGIWLFSSKHYVASGLAVAIGIGVKLYPVLFVPPLLVLALRQGNAKRFTAGLAFGLLPMGLLSFYLPWWRFAEFQTARGLQVESLYAAVVWLGNLLGFNEAHWTYTNKWYEVHGPLATAILPWARGLFIAGVGGSTLIAVRAAAKLQNVSAPPIARLLLIPLLAFVALNQVLSPQYMIWLLPLAALGSLEGKSWALGAISLATMLTPLFYPVPDYYHPGLNLVETIILLCRDFILIAVWVSLIRESFQKLRPNETGSCTAYTHADS